MKTAKELDQLMDTFISSTKRNSLDFVALKGSVLYEALGVSKLNACDYNEIKALGKATDDAGLFLYTILDMNGRDDVVEAIFSKKEFEPLAQTFAGSMDERIKFLADNYNLKGAIVEPS